MSLSFSLGEKNSTLLSVDSPHEASQSSHSGGQRTISHAPSLNEGGAGGTDLRDGSTTVDNRLRKAHAANRVESAPLKTELIPGSHEKSNSSLIEVIILRTLIEQVRQMCNCLTVPRVNLSE